VQAIFGAYKIQSGKIFKDGHRIKNLCPMESIEKWHIAFVPEDRRKFGVLTEFSIKENISLPKLKELCHKLMFIDFRREEKTANKIIQELKIKCHNENQKVKYLSGGNQQKVAIGKWLFSNSDVYIFDEPTKGVDVEAKEELFRIIVNLADQGAAIIYSTIEIDEVLRLSDRVLVMYDGRIIKELNTSSTNENEILFYASGGNYQGPKKC